jgi:hypothetical protein
MNQPWFPDPQCAPCPPPFPPCPPPVFSPPTPPWYPGANAGVSFGTQFPPNPCRGHFLWDGSILWMWDGVAWQKIGPVPPIASGIPEAPIDGNIYGRENAAWVKVTAQATFEFAMVQPTAVTVGVDANHWTAIPFTSTPSTDLLGGWNPATLRYTPNVAGLYSFSARGRQIGTAAGIAVVKNDPGTYTSLSSDITVCIASSSGTGWIQCSGYAQMNGTTDYVRMWGYETTGSFPNSGSNVVFSGVKF